MDEKDFDFDNLTKEQTIYLHRKLWNTIADEIMEWKRPVEKCEIFRLYEWPEVQADCWCCEYDNLFPGPCCNCPIDWGTFARVCDWVGSPYKKWKDQMDIYRMRRVKPTREDLKKLSKCAREIANLPERKD